MSEEILTEVIAGPEEEGLRLDVFLSRRPGVLSRSAAQKMISGAKVRVDGELRGKNYRLSSGQTVVFSPEEVIVTKTEGEDLPLSIIFEDEQIIVVDKAPGMVVHPGAGNYNGTLVNALLGHCDLANIGAPLRPGIVHRLDKDTSGLMVAAKTDSSYMSLVEQIKGREVRRDYLAVVEGSFSQPNGEIDAPLGRSTKDRKLMQVGGGGAKSAYTSFRVIRSVGAYSLLKVTLKTGRTHQIRVHMGYINHPIVGDKVYGSGKRDVPGGPQRQWLHAAELSFKHPETEAKLEFKSEPPPDLKGVLDELGLSE